jgi:hypothetical protein
MFRVNSHQSELHLPARRRRRSSDSPHLGKHKKISFRLELNQKPWDITGVLFYSPMVFQLSYGSRRQKSVHSSLIKLAKAK